MENTSGALRRGDERIHEHAHQIFSVDAGVARLALGLCSFLKLQLLLVSTAARERNAAHVGSSEISAGTQLELKLICRGFGKGRLIFTDDPLPNTAGSSF